VTVSSVREQATTVFVVILAGALAVLAWHSLRWPLGANVAVQHYIAWLIGQGFAPYRDVFDPNVPGVWIVHGVALAAVGPGDIGWRVWDLSWLGVTAFTLYRYCRPLASRWSAAAAAVLFALYHVGGGDRHAGERDFFVCLPLLLGVLAVATWCERDSGGVLGALAGGLALGFATTIKPTAVLFAAGCGAAAALGARSRARRLTGPIALGAGMAVVPLLMLGWLAWHGSLAPFVAIVTDYTLPIFSETGRNRLWRFGKPYWLTLGAVVVIGLALGPPPGRRLRWSLALFGIGYGILHVVLQFKGTWYHFHPFALFMCLVAAPAVAPRALEPGRWWATLGVPAARWWAALRVPVALALVAASAVLMATRDGMRFASDPVAEERARRVVSVMRDLEPRVGRRDTVQVLDVVEGGGALALLRLRLYPANRFINDEPLFLAPHDPRIQRLRAEFMAALTSRPPAAVVVFPRRWRHQGYGRLREFPELVELLAERYTLAVNRDDYEIFVQRPPAARADSHPGAANSRSGVGATATPSSDRAGHGVRPRAG
jgi:hypothetical protein